MHTVKSKYFFDLFSSLDVGAFHVSETRHVTVTSNQININAMSAFFTKVGFISRVLADIITNQLP